ncbi:Cell division control protein 2 [Castilleja foliolosa]|uniref:Cell division control protein 2 n=1 Tax=Castilleja foliolosa TaxID=1961234 RepID=A0ABD3DU18_9LAMI
MKKMIKMKKARNLIPYVTIMVILLLPGKFYAVPRTQTVSFECGSQPENNVTLYVPNFVTTMENISAQIRVSGFGVAQTGSGLDTNYALAQCYGDLSLVDCVLCYAEARTLLPQCYPMTGGRLYLDGCFMRSENFSFFDEFTGPGDRAICGNITRQDPPFQESTRRAVSQAVSTAGNGNGFARAQVPISGAANESVYVLAECWRTISPEGCRACLENATASILGCLPSSEGRARNTGCFMRYSDRDFLNPETGTGSSRGRIIAIVIASVSAVAVLITGAFIGFYIWRNKVIKNKRKGDAHKLVKTLHDSSLNFKYSTLDKATGSFDEANKLGQGGFGTVYKGVLQDGREIAVKRLFFNNKHRAADFYNEVNIISSVEHKNLVRLLGCSCSGPESLLVYEFLPNKSLDRFIFESSKGKALNWEKRFEIIIGTAEGLVYLHENTKIRIIHRDIKSSNILLDSRLRAKIADFGLARSFQEDKSHISTAIAGTLGYMAPEYLAHGQLTEKADVYSFGVLLLEIVTGRQNNRSKDSEYTDSLISIVWKHFQQRTVEELLDPNLMHPNYHNNINVKNEMLRVIHVGLLCTQEIPTLRPSMSKALLMLVSKDELPGPTNPPFMDEKTMELNDMTVFTLVPPDHGDGASIASISQSIFYPR